MNVLSLFGSDKPNVISDELFQNSNIEYINIFHKTCDFLTKQPETEGDIVLSSGSVEGKRIFKGNSITEVLQQMMEFCKTIK